MPQDITSLIALEAIMLDKMREIRGQRVMLDIDLAELYEVNVSYLRKQVTRNIDRFPEDFMFRLTKQEFKELKSYYPQGSKRLPYVFTEKGILMAGGLLNSKRAIKTHIQMISHFTQLYSNALSQYDMRLKLEQLEERMFGDDKELKLIFSALKEMMSR
ncbi:MAG: ORF6N domain-containing protein [Bacteroidota bacterium]